MLTAEQVSLLKCELGPDEDTLTFVLLSLAVACAHAPLSNFNVGTISRSINDNWYFGGSTGFLGTTMQQTAHTEQSAISHVWLRDEKGLAVITVNYAPCGHCRQFMNELSSGLDLCIHLSRRAPRVLHDCPPNAFNPKGLGIKTLLMDDQDHGFALQDDTLTQTVITATNRCHMPYSKSPNGMTLECKDGHTFSGSYAEDVAFNPTLPPLQSVLNLLSLDGYDYPDIQRATLAEKVDASLIQWDTTSATLKALGYDSIEHIPLG